ncbi:NAD-binding protein [Chytridium lagenaria]|nr:NAD-binding protein [Chytridium lagenaria]
MPSPPTSMQALVLAESAPKESKDRYDPLVLKTVPIPSDVPEGHVLVKLMAAALNHRDVYIREGNYPAIQYGSILGSDGAGIVVASNPKDPNIIGKRVVLNPTVGWEEDPETPENIFEFGIMGHLPLPGTFAEYICVPKSAAIQLPEHLSFVDGSSFPVAGVTAWRAVFTLGKLKPGHKVLIPGIGGGVALFALQFAIAAGATVYVTSSSDDKIKKAVGLGAEGGVNYRNDSWVSELESESGGFFDLVVDGAAGPNVKSYVRLLKPGGTIAIYGAVSGSTGTINFPYLWFKHLTIKGACMGSLKEFKDMMKFVDQHKIKPVIAGTYRTLGDAEKAFEIMRSVTPPSASLFY